MLLATALHANHSQDSPHGCLWVRKYKMSHFHNSTTKFKFIFPNFKRSETQKVLKDHIFSLSIFSRNLVVTDVRSSGHMKNNLKSMHFSVKSILCIFWPTGMHWAILFVICIWIFGLKLPNVTERQRLLVYMEIYKVILIKVVWYIIIKGTWCFGCCQAH